jgi:hypothetical protein
LKAKKFFYFSLTPLFIGALVSTGNFSKPSVVCNNGVYEKSDLENSLGQELISAVAIGDTITRTAASENNFPNMNHAVGSGNWDTKIRIDLLQAFWLKPEEKKATDFIFNPAAMFVVEENSSKTDISNMVEISANIAPCVISTGDAVDLSDGFVHHTSTIYSVDHTKQEIILLEAKEYALNSFLLEGNNLIGVSGKIITLKNQEHKANGIKLSFVDFSKIIQHIRYLNLGADLLLYRSEIVFLYLSKKYSKYEFSYRYWNTYFSTAKVKNSNVVNKHFLTLILSDTSYHTSADKSLLLNLSFWQDMYHLLILNDEKTRMRTGLGFKNQFGGMVKEIPWYLSYKLVAALTKVKSYSLANDYATILHNQYKNDMDIKLLKSITCFYHKMRQCAIKNAEFVLKDTLSKLLKYFPYENKNSLIEIFAMRTKQFKYIMTWDIGILEYRLNQSVQILKCVHENSPTPNFFLQPVHQACRLQSR